MMGEITWHVAERDVRGKVVGTTRADSEADAHRLAEALQELEADPYVYIPLKFSEKAHLVRKYEVLWYRKTRETV